MRIGMPISDDVVVALAHDVANLAPFILVADDDDGFRERLVSGLRGKGFNVIEARSGDGAVELCRTARPGGVVMDYRFDEGGLNGIQAMKEIRRMHPNHDGLNAVIVTENESEPGVRDQGDPVLSKSETDEIMLERIAKSCFEGIKRQVAEMIMERFRPTFDALDSYRSFLGDPDVLEEVACYRGTVIDVDISDLPDAARIRLFRKDGSDFCR